MDGQFNQPPSLATDKNGLIYVAEFDGKRIQIFNEGKFIRKWDVDENCYELCIAENKILLLFHSRSN